MSVIPGQQLSRVVYQPPTLALLSYKLRRKLESELYRVPSPKHGWDDIQAASRTSWADLFFDLVLVAVVFSLGNVLSQEIKSPSPGGGIERAFLFVFILFVFFFDNWMTKSHVRSIFNLKDVFHKFTDVLESLVTALLAIHLVSVAEMISSQENKNEYNWLFAITSIKLIYQIVVLSVWMEVFMFSKEPVSVKMARRSLTSSFVPMLPLVAALFTSAFRLDWRITIALWFLSPMLYRLGVLVNTWLRVSNHTNSLPVHVEYLMERSTDFVMVMLGEGILSISTVRIDTNRVIEHICTFCMSFGILAGLLLTHHVIMPREPDDHVLRRSRWRGWFWVQVSMIYNFSFFLLGVSLKDNLSSLRRQKKESYRSFTMVMAVALLSSISFMIIAKLLHIGWAEIVQNTPRRLIKKRVKYWVARILVPLAYLSIPFQDFTESFKNAAIAFGITFVIVSINIFDAAIADDSRPAEFDESLEQTDLDDLEKDFRRLSVNVDEITARMQQITAGKREIEGKE